MYKQFVLEIIDLNIKNKVNLDDFKNLKRDFAKRNKLSDLPTNIKLLRAYHQLLQDKKISKNIEIETLFKKRSVRSESGIVAVQVLTKPYPCPGQCIFCPDESGMPKSYISTEPGAMRAALNQFDPIKQVYNRLLSLTMTGHQTDKIEMIILGGTWDYYPRDYKIDFIKKLYDACNTFSQLKITIPNDNGNYKDFTGLISNESNQAVKTKKYGYDISNLDTIVYSDSIELAIKTNETAQHRVIGLTVETRPEYIIDDNCKLWRELGITRLEIGVQTMYNNILDANKRGHTVQQIRDGIHKLRQYGFKFSIHIMPGLYNSDYEKDLGTFKQIYSDPFIKPDEIKFYPTSVIPNTKLYDLYVAGEYLPLTTAHIQNLIRETFQEIIPPYTRIKRLIRDIPATEIIAGSNITNLAQLTHNELKKELKVDAIKAKNLYHRLYGNYQLFSTIGQFINSINNIDQQESEIDTYIVGQKPDLDTYRNFVSLDTRSREIRQKKLLHKNKVGSEIESANLVLRKYQSSVGVEYFISFEDLQGYLYGFTRLLLPKIDQTISWDGLGPNIALIRELHIYGQLASLKGNVDTKDKKQHKGFGTQLMSVAEKLSKKLGYKKLSVISGVGVRGFYQKIGYLLEGTYMIKFL